MTERAVRLFDSVAASYDEILPFFSGFARLHLAWLAPDAGSRVLDLGAGRGALTGAALERGCTVSAVDVSPGMVERLATAYPAVQARVMDAQRLDFPDDSFDLVCAGFVIHLLDDPAAAAAEVRRVLAPGGVFSFSLPGAVRDAPEWAFYGELFGEFQAFVPAGQGRLSRPLDPEPLLAAAGFTGIEETDVEQRLPVPDADTFWNWALSHGSRAFIDALPPQQRARFEARLRARLATMDPIVHASGANLWRGRA